VGGTQGHPARWIKCDAVLDIDETDQRTGGELRWDNAMRGTRLTFDLLGRVDPEATPVVSPPLPNLNRLSALQDQFSPRLSDAEPGWYMLASGVVQRVARQHHGRILAHTPAPSNRVRGSLSVRTSLS
jgi:hypothetical protein